MDAVPLTLGPTSSIGTTDGAGRHATRQIGPTRGRRRRRLQRRPDLVERGRELLQFDDAPGDLRLLVVDQASDALLGGGAVHPTPDGQELATCSQLRPILPGPVHEQQQGRRVLAVVAVSGAGARRACRAARSARSSGPSTSAPRPARPTPRSAPSHGRPDTGVQGQRLTLHSSSRSTVATSPAIRPDQKEHEMGTFTRENTEIAVNIEGFGEQHRAAGGRDGDRARTVDRRPGHHRDVRRASRRRLPGTPLRLHARRLGDGALHRRRPPRL